MNDVAEVAVEALPVTLPVRLAVIIPALKFPEASRLTRVDTVLALTALFANVAALATLAALTPPTLATDVAPWVPVTSPLSVPVKLVAEVAVDALPVKLPVTLPVTLPVRLAVILPALKLPEASRFTIVEAVLALVAAAVSLTEVAIDVDVFPPTVETVGPGKLPVRSPLAAPVGATPETQLRVPVPLVESTWPAVPFVPGSSHVICEASVSGALKAT